MSGFPSPAPSLGSPSRALPPSEVGVGLLSPTHQFEFATLRKRIAHHHQFNHQTTPTNKRNPPPHMRRHEESKHAPAMREPSHYLQELHSRRAAESPKRIGPFLPAIQVTPHGPHHQPGRQQKQPTKDTALIKQNNSHITTMMDADDAPADASSEELLSPPRPTALDFSSSPDPSHAILTTDPVEPRRVNFAIDESTDPFESFHPTAVSAAAATANHAFSYEPIASLPAHSAQVTYMEWQLPSSFATHQQIMLTSPSKKLTRQQAALAMANMGSSEYVLGVLDEVDPPLHTLSIYLDSWLDRYIDEPMSFDSLAVFISVKYEELRHLLSKLHRPNSFRTWICADLLLKLLATLPGQPTNNDNTGGRIITQAQQLGQELLAELLNNIYTKLPSPNFGLKPYQLHARESLLHVHDRILQRAEGLSRVREFHLHRCKILQAWQPCINRAIRTWHTPILAVCFLRWKRWRIDRIRRGIAETKRIASTQQQLANTVVAANTSAQPQQLLDASRPRTFLAVWQQHLLRRWTQTQGAVVFLHWKLCVSTKHLNTALASMDDLNASISTSRRLLADARSIQSSAEDKLRALIKHLWQVQHDVLDLKCRIKEEQETHKVHAGQKAATIILTQWYRYLYLHLTSNHQRAFDANYSMNFQDTSTLLSNVQSQRMRHLFDGFKRHGGDVEAFSTIKQMLNRSTRPVTNAVGTNTNNLNATPATTPSNTSSGRNSATNSKRASLKAGVTIQLEQAPTLQSLPTATSKRASLQSSANRRRSGFTPAMLDSLRRANGEGQPLEITRSDAPFSSITEEGAPSPAIITKESSIQPMEGVSLDALSGVAPALDTDPSVSAILATPLNDSIPEPRRSPLLRAGRRRSSDSKIVSGPASESVHVAPPVIDEPTISKRGSRRSTLTSSGNRRVTLVTSNSASASRPNSSLNTAGSATSVRASRPTLKLLPPPSAAASAASQLARKRWRMALMAVIYSLKPTPEPEEIRITALGPKSNQRDKDTMMLNSWMKYQVHAWRDAHLILSMSSSGVGSSYTANAPITVALASDFVRFLVHHTNNNSNAPIKPLRWSEQLSYALTSMQKALAASDVNRILPNAIPPPPPPSLHTIKPSLTSNLNLVAQCTLAHPHLALNPSELHLVQMGMAQVLSVGFTGDVVSPDADIESGLFYAVWLRLFSVLPSLPCDFDGGGLDFDSIFLRLSESAGLTRLMLHSEGGYITSAAQLNNYLESMREMRFAVKKKRIEMGRSHATYLKQKRAMTAAVSNKLGILIRDADREARVIQKNTAAMTSEEVDFGIINQLTAATTTMTMPTMAAANTNGGTDSGSASNISSAMVSRRASISIALGTGLLSPMHNTSVAGVLSGSLIGPPAMLSAVGSVGLTAVNSYAPSAFGSVMGSAMGSALPSVVATARDNKSADDSNSTLPAPTPSAAECDSTRGDSSSITAAAAAPVAIESPGGEVASHATTSDNYQQPSDHNQTKDKQQQQETKKEEKDDDAKDKEGEPDNTAADLVKEDNDVEDKNVDAVGVDDVVDVSSVLSDPKSASPFSSDDDGDDAAAAPVDSPTEASATADAADASVNGDGDGDVPSLDLVGEGQLQGVEDLSSTAPDSDRNRTPVPVAAYEVDIIHSTLVSLVNQEAALRVVQLSKGGARGSMSAAHATAATWSMIGHAIEIRRCEQLIATHLSQIRKWYRTCLGDEVVKQRGKARNKNAAGSDILVVTKDKVIKLFTRAKLMTAVPVGAGSIAPGGSSASGAPAGAGSAAIPPMATTPGGLTNATITQAWNEIAAWKSDKDEAQDETTSGVIASSTALSFDAAIALLCKLSTIRFRSRAYRLPHVSERLNAFLQLCFPLQVLPYTSMASKFYPLQAALSNANSLTTIGSSANQLTKPGDTPHDTDPAASASAPPPMAYLGAQSAFEGDENEDALIRRLCDDVLRANQKWLFYLFTYYAKEKEVVVFGTGVGSMEPALSRDNFMDVINDSQLLKEKVVYLRTINSIWIAQQQSQAAAIAAEAAANPNATQKPTGDSMMTYRYFLDSLRVICVFYVRDPMVPLPVKLDRLVAFLWGCPGFERCRVSMGVSSAVQTAAANNAAQAQLAKEQQQQHQQQQQQQ